MGFKPIEQPSDSSFQGANGSCRLSWSPGYPNRMNKLMSAKQKIIDSEVLRLCSPMVPHRTGTLERSGTLGTVIGSGEVKYIAPYARTQYYNTSTSRSYDPRRGGKWFERMKPVYLSTILSGAAKIAGARRK